jgi:tetratricopeptide (TPR) repeat protein
MRLMPRLLPLGIAILALSGCQSPQAKEASYLGKGKKEFQKKHYDVAIIYFKNAIDAQPKDAEPYYQLGLAYLASNDVGSAASSFKKATELNPKHTGAQLRLSELMAASRSQAMVQEAQKRTEVVLALLPDDAEALNLLAFTELRLGKPESAEAHLEQVLRKSPGNLRSSVTLAQTRLARHDVAGAEEALKQAVAQAPKSPDPVVYLGGFYLALGKTAEAEQQYRHALEIDPKHGAALVALGAMQMRAGQSDQAEQTYRRLSALPNKGYKPLHALFLFQTGKRDQAVAELERLAREDPGDRDARTRLVAAYLAVNRVGDAEKVLTAALKKNPRDIDALLQRSRIYLGHAKYAEAESDLNQVLRFRKDDADAHYLFSKLHQARGESTIRQQELGEALRLNPAFTTARAELAQMLITSRAADSALKILDEAPAAQKGTALIVLQRNWALLALGQAPEARKGIDQFLAMGRSSDALLQDAVLKMSQKDYSGARASAEEILKKDPGNSHALNVLVLTYAEQKQMPAGVQRAREYAARQPASAAVQEFLGQLLSGNGDRAGARKAFEAAKAANPALVAADLELAELDTSEGKRQEARKRLSDVVASHPDNEMARLLLAQLETGDGASAAAIEQYRKVLAQDGKNAKVLNNLAYLLADGNQWDEALKYAQEAKQLDPNSASADDTLGWTYFRKGLYPMAVTYLESATAKEGTALRKYHLAMAYLKAGNPKRGRQVLDEAMKMDPKLPEADMARRLFGSAKP